MSQFVFSVNKHELGEKTLGEKTLIVNLVNLWEKN